MGNLVEGRLPVGTQIEYTSTEMPAMVGFGGTIIQYDVYDDILPYLVELDQQGFAALGVRTLWVRDGSFRVVSLPWETS